MKQIKINLRCFINNWPQYIKDEFEPEDDKGIIKHVNTFYIDIAENDNIDMVQKRLTSHLFNLLVKDEQNWKNASRCMFCFNTNVALDEDEGNIIQCQSCDRIYSYNERFDSIPLPSMKYLFLYKNSTPLIYTNDYDLSTPINFLPEIFHYENINIDFFNELRTRFINDGEPQIIDNRLLKFQSSIDELDMIYFPDFYLFMEQVNINYDNTIKRGYSKIFWNVNYDVYKKKLLDSNFTEDNNRLNILNKTITLNRNTVIEYSKLEVEELVNISKGFSRIMIKVYQDNTIPFINLLRIFHLFNVSEHVPFISLFIDKIGQKRHKILRSLSDDLVSQWVEQNIKTKQLLFKVKIKNSYFTMLLTPTNMIKIIFPLSIKLDIKKEIFEEIATKVNKIIAQISKLSFREKLYPNKNIQYMSTDVDKWGTDNITEFAPLSLTTTFQAKDIDMIHLGSIIDCLKPYALINNIDDNEISFLYIFDVDSKQGLRYDKYLWNLIKYKIRKHKPVDMDDIKIQFGQEFDLDGTQLDVIFQHWMKQNKNTLESILQNVSLIHKFKPILDGIVVKIERVNEFFNVNIQGIKYWHQDKDILLFIQRLFKLQETIETNKFFKENCVGIISKSIKKKRGTNLKIGLKRFLPDIFWDSTNKDDQGFTRKCQKKEQPLIFTDETEYLNWMQDQMPKNLSETQKIFTRNCPTISTEELTKRLINLSLPIPERRVDKCVQYQRKIFEMTKYSKDDLQDILIALQLPVPTTITKRKDAIIRYFNIQTFLNQENVDNVYPNPQTFIIKRNDKKFYLTCPNGLDNPKSKNAKYIGFLNIDENPNAKRVSGNDKRKFCVPCCKKLINEPRVDFCSAVIDYDELLSGTASSTEYIKNEKKFPLLFNRYGHLHNILHDMFNIENNQIMEKSIRLGLIKKPLYLRKGIVQNNFSFLQAVLSVLPEQLSVHHALKLINTRLTKSIFRSLNSGNLYWEYNGSIKQFKNIFSITNFEKINIQHLWELISMPGILTPLGFNILILEVNKKNIGSKSIEEIHVICPQNQEIDHFYDSKRSTIMLYHQDEYYEPIILYISNAKQIGLYNFENMDESLFSVLKNWYKDACSVIELDKEMTAKSLIKRFNNYIKIQLIDRFNKVRYLITTDNIMIPTIPSGLSLEKPVAILSSESIILNSFSKTMKFLKQNNFKPEKIIVKDNFITHIIMKNEQFIPIQPSPIPADNNLEITESLLDYTNIDNLILDNIDQELFTNIQRGDYHKESYEMFRYHFSNFITPENRQRLFNKEHVETDIMNQFLQTITIIDEMNIDEYDKPNIRLLCKDTSCDNPHCVIVNGKCTLAVMRQDIDVFTKRLLNELKQYKLKRYEIVNNTLDSIIDLTRFVPTREYFFK